MNEPKHTLHLNFGDSTATVRGVDHDNVRIFLHELSKDGCGQIHGADKTVVAFAGSVPP